MCIKVTSFTFGKGGESGYYVCEFFRLIIKGIKVSMVVCDTSHEYLIPKENTNDTKTLVSRND